jgi:hypothetical protein
MDDEYDPEVLPVHLEIDGELDLHTFSPKDVKALIANYLPKLQTG